MRKFLTTGDVLIFLGIALVTFGVWQMHRPGAFIFLGIVTAGIGYLKLPRLK